MSKKEEFDKKIAQLKQIKEQIKKDRIEAIKKEKKNNGKNH